MLYVELIRRPITWHTPSWATSYTRAPVQDRPGIAIIDVGIKRWARPLIWLRNLWWEICARDLIVWRGERVVCHHCDKVDRLTGLMADSLRRAKRVYPVGVYTCAACLAKHVWFLKGAGGSWIPKDIVDEVAAREVSNG